MNSQLRADEERQQFALEAAGAGTWTWDLESGDMNWSSVTFRLHGVEQGVFVPTYQRWLDLIDAGSRAAAKLAVNAAIGGGAPEFRLEYPVGSGHSVRQLLAVGKVQPEKRGRPRSFLAVITDVTERHAALAALAEGEGRYRTLFEMAPVGIIMVDPADGHIVAFNGKAHEVLGYSVEEFSRLSLSDVEARLGPEEVRRTLAELCQSDAMVQFETKHRRKDGSLVDVLASAHRTEFGGETFIYKIWQDITGMKQIERQLVAARQAAERADMAKGQFLASASHDLRQPVQSLVFFHSALTAKLKGHPAYPLLDHMQTGLDGLKAILDGLLDISKLHAGTVEIRATVFPISALFTRLEGEYAPKAADKGLGLRFVTSSAWVRSDTELLERMLRQLIDNAIKYCAAGSVLVGCRRQGGNIRVDVVDTGAGIPDDKLEDIFHEFVQLGNSERDRAKGLGLGLAIVRHLGQMLGHEVAVKSHMGYGTVFSITVPQAKPRSPARRRPVTEGKGRHRRVLVIEDEGLVRDAMLTILEGADWEVLAAGSGPEAVALMSTHAPPDVIVSDYRLPGPETGVGLIARIRTICGQEIPGLILTGDTAPERILECERSGLALMHKPVASEALQTALVDLCSPPPPDRTSQRRSRGP